VGAKRRVPPAAYSPEAVKKVIGSASGRPNRAEWVIIQYATARIGAILVNINPAYKTAELSYALQQSGASLILLARAFPHRRLRGHAGRGSAAAVPTCANRLCSTTAGMLS